MYLPGRQKVSSPKTSTNSNELLYNGTIRIKDPVQAQKQKASLRSKMMEMVKHKKASKKLAIVSDDRTRDR